MKNQTGPLLPRNHSATPAVQQFSEPGKKISRPIPLFAPLLQSIRSRRTQIRRPRARAPVEQGHHNSQDKFNSETAAAPAYLSRLLLRSTRCGCGCGAAKSPGQQAASSHQACPRPRRETGGLPGHGLLAALSAAGSLALLTHTTYSTFSERKISHIQNTK